MAIRRAAGPNSLPVAHRSRRVVEFEVAIFAVIVSNGLVAFGNRLLVIAAGAELVFAALALLVTPVATFLGHENPPAVGWLVALVSIPVVVLVDAVSKRAVR